MTLTFSLFASIDLKVPQLASPHALGGSMSNTKDVDCSLFTFARSNFGAPRILCFENDVAVLETRCAVLQYSGYDASSASPKLAEIALSSRKFDLIVLSQLSDFDLNRIINLADGADVLVLDEFTYPQELLFLVVQRLNRRRRQA
jgi:hypothetical protein